MACPGPELAKLDEGDAIWMRRALREAKRGYGLTSPNPMVGAVLVADGRLLGQGWHHGAGQPHAEIEALANARRHGCQVKGATLYVTLEPCCTHGRTPPCTDAIVAAGILRVLVAATDPNPRHQGRGFEILRAAGIEVQGGLLSAEATELNCAFNHWIQTRLPYVTLKAAMTLDGKVATASGESKWITGEPARREAMRLRRGADAILVGIQTVLADNPSLTVRSGAGLAAGRKGARQPLRVVLDSAGRTPLCSKLTTDQWADRTLIVTTAKASRRRVEALAKKVRVVTAPDRDGRVDLLWLLRLLGGEQVTSLLVEGGGEVHAGFLAHGLVQEVALFYAPKVLGGRLARRAVAGEGATEWGEVHRLTSPRWRRFGQDLLLTAKIENPVRTGAR